MRTPRTPPACWSSAQLSVRGRYHLRDSGNAGVAAVEVAARIHRHVVGLDELALASARSGADGAEHATVPVDLENLTVLTGRQPQLLVRIDVQRAREIPHLDRLDERAACVVDDEAVF